MPLLWAIVMLVCLFLSGCVAESKMALRTKQLTPSSEPQIEASIEITVR